MNPVIALTVDAIQKTEAEVAVPVQTAQEAQVRVVSGRVENKATAYEQFEAFVLQSFIQSIMPKEASSVFGEGTAGEVWKSMLAEKIAMQVAQAGGIGIGKLIGPGAAGSTVQSSDESAAETNNTPGPGNVAQSLLEWQLKTGADGAGAAAALHAGGDLAAAAKKSGI